jgi:hypothetical protein
MDRARIERPNSRSAVNGNIGTRRREFCNHGDLAPARFPGPNGRLMITVALFAATVGVT